MTPYEPSYIPQAMPSDAFKNNAPNVANGGFNPAGASKWTGQYMGALGALGAAAGSPQQQPQAPPPPQLGQGAGVHPGAPGGGMDPAALQNMMQIYHTLQPSGQLGMQMQAAGVGTQQPPAPVPGLLSRFQ